MLPSEITEILSNFELRKKVNHVMSALSYNTPLLMALYTGITTSPSFEDTTIFQETTSNINSLFEDSTWYDKHRNEIQGNLEQLNSKCIPAKQPIAIPTTADKKYTFPSVDEKKEFWNRTQELIRYKIDDMENVKDTDYLIIHACKLSQEQLNMLRDPSTLVINYSWIHKIAEFLFCTPDYLIGNSDYPTLQAGLERAISFAPIGDARSFISQYLSQHSAKKTLNCLIILLIALPESDKQALQSRFLESYYSSEYNKK